MGLDTTHGCFHGPYSAFSDWRGNVCAVAGYGPLDEYVGFGGSMEWPDPKEDPLILLLRHSDCDGEISAKDCGPIAARLMSILPSMKICGNWYLYTTQQWIDGLNTASKAGECVEFR